MECWYNTITAAASTDGGRSFTRTSPPAVMAAAPFRQEVDQGRHRGFFNPSNIVAEGRYRYVLASTTGWERPGSDQPGGVCLFRTETPADPASWRAWTGTGFTAAFPDPYRAGVKAAATCKPVAPFPTPVGSVLRHRGTGAFIAVFMAKQAEAFPQSGFYWTSSRDLITWDPPRLLLAGATLYDDPCRDAGRPHRLSVAARSGRPGPQLRRRGRYGDPHLRHLADRGLHHHLRPRPRAPAGGDQGLALTRRPRRDRSWNREEDPMTPHCLAWDDLPETRAPNGVAKRVLEGPGATLVRVVVPAGVAATRHSHPHEQFVQVISGSGTLETAQGRRAFGPGSLFHFPPETWHAAEFDAETVLVETNFRE